MKFFKKIFLASVVLFAPLISWAEEASIAIPETNLPSAGVADILKNILDWLLGVVGVVALIAFIVSGIMYLTAVGDSDQAEKAKKTMFNALIGVVVVLAAFIVIQTIDSAFNASLY